MGIKIITDSTSDFGKEEARALNVAVVPLKTIFGEKEYLDGVELMPDEFYTKLAQSKQLPTTSQPSPWDFEQVFRRAQEDGDQIITICIAGSLSGTCQSANAAKEACGGDIWVIDSGTTTIGMQLLVRLAVQLRDSGMAAEDIVNIIEKEKRSIYIFAVVDTLEYLYKGGRLTRASAFAGTLFHMKPLIMVHKGQIKAIGKCLGLKKAYAEIFLRIESVGGMHASKPFAIGYTGDRAHFTQFEQIYTQRHEKNAPIAYNIGSVIGTHAGPGAVAIAFYKGTQ